MTAFTDLRRVTLHGMVTRVDGQPAVGAVLVSVDGPTQDQSAGQLIVNQPDRLVLVNGGFMLSVPARAVAPAPLVEVIVQLEDNQRPVLFQFEVVTDADNVTWEVTV